MSDLPRLRRWIADETMGNGLCKACSSLSRDSAPFMADPTDKHEQDCIPSRVRDLIARADSAEAALRVSEAQKGYATLIALLAETERRGMSCPEVVIETDGTVRPVSSVCFDWQLRADCVLSISVSPAGRIGWSALIGDFSTHGHSDDGTYPPDLVKALDYYATELKLP